ncbi:LacI family DNA-binding transcriptional regulator [Solitalea lacus]|uniref:LacI family DNA-binding transcriptional regulator n=1 Tax=Solitalea lacus TaxID=2911172 RepID=UPI001EDA75B2|nr:LacI family DNA-binding transcriptional regulator [Solitalea lacus]UKJ08441.1 LacI family transcriptional regulator [Solitalea lacus]
MKKTTIHDIARELNITFSTVAKALNDHPRIKASTKIAVKEMATKLNYQQNKLASSLKSGKTGIIGVLVPTLDVSFFSSVVHGIENVMNENGYSILLYQSKEQQAHEIKGIETFLQSRVEGIISSVSLETTCYNHFKELKEYGIPLLLFDRTVDEIGVPYVRIDDYQGGFIATEHLINKGCKRIIHISSQHNIKIFQERLRGYMDALSQYNIPIDDQLIITGNPSIELGMNCVKTLFENKIYFDGVFAFEDYTGLGVLKQLNTLGIKVPEEVKVIGFANEAFGAHITPTLSTVDQQTVKMGEESAKLFLKLLKGKNYYQDKAEGIILEPILIARKSTGE